MLELKRILKTPSKLLLLILLIILNILTFSYCERKEYDDIHIFSKYYNEELAKIENMTQEERIAYLGRNYRLSNELISYVQSLDGDGIKIYSQEVIDFYYNNPDMVENIKNGNIDTTEEKEKEKVFTKLLEQVNYQENYSSFLENIEEKENELLEFSIFNNKNSFSYKNILKTAEDYSTLKNINLELGNYLAVEEIENYNIINLFLILIILIVVFSFIDDRKKGLTELINSTVNGRKRLIVDRICALFITSILAVIILFGSNLSVAFMRYGGLEDINNLIISVPIFQNFTLAIMIKEYLLIFIFVKILSIFFIGLIIWYVISKIKNIKLSFLVLICIFAVEYILFIKINFNSYISILKAVNIFSLIDLNNSFREYMNINLFGKPINLLNLIYIVLGIGISILLILHIFKNVYQKKLNIAFLEKIKKKFAMICTRFVNRFSFVLYEIYKVVILQKGWVILILFAYLMLNFDYLGSSEDVTMEQQVVNAYSKQYEGEIDENLPLEIKKLEEQFNKTIQEFEEKKIKYQNGEINYYEYYSIKVDAEQAATHLEGLKALKEKVNNLIEQSEKNQYKLWLLDETPFENAYGNQSVVQQKTSLYIAIILLVLLFSNIFTFENESNIDMLIHTVKHRKKIMRLKVISTLVITIVIGLFISITGFSQFYGTINPITLKAPIQSLEMLSNCPLNISISTFISIIYAIRIILLILITDLILFISCKSKKTIYSMCASLLATTGIIVILNII